MLFIAVIIILLYFYFIWTLVKKRSLILEIMNFQLSKFFMHLSTKYFIASIDNITPDTAKYIPLMQQLFDRFEFYNLKEISPNNYGKDTAYTINKKYIYICLKNAVYPYNIYNLNTALFVLLHELTHLSNIKWDHSEDFWRLFKFYLTEAVNCQIYTPVDYKLHPEKYCNTMITYNPLFDDKIVL